jgi:hypothetical protein
MMIPWMLLMIWKSNPNFPGFEDAASELQLVNLTRLNEKALLAFGINVYKLMLKYALMKVGVGITDASRAAFIRSLKFNVGGTLFSFHDWLHGIIRGNRPPPPAFFACVIW